MSSSNTAKKWVIAFMVFFVALTATPLAFMGNSLEPLIFGIPYFFFWCMFWPTMVMLTQVMYILIEDHGWFARDEQS